MKNKKKKTKKLSQFLKSHILGTFEAILLKFGMWSPVGGGSVHSKNRLVSSRQHRAMEVRKLHFLSSCQHTHRCCAPASWAARHTTVCLDFKNSNMGIEIAEKSKETIVEQASMLNKQRSLFGLNGYGRN